MGLNHVHLIVRAECLSSPSEGSEKNVNKQVKQLIKDIKMEVLFEPRSKYFSAEGNLGLSWLAGLTTSHCSFHAYIESNKETLNYKHCDLIHMDTYTCGALWNEEVTAVLRYLEQYSPQHVNLSIIDREHNVGQIAANAVFDIKDGSFEDFVSTLKLKHTLSYKISKAYKSFKEFMGSIKI